MARHCRPQHFKAELVLTNMCCMTLSVLLELSGSLLSSVVKYVS